MWKPSKPCLYDIARYEPYPPNPRVSWRASVRLPDGTKYVFLGATPELIVAQVFNRHPDAVYAMPDTWPRVERPLSEALEAFAVWRVL